jgi:hypothetical protein
MSEWKGPWTCEKCGAATCDNEWQEFENENGKYHFYRPSTDELTPTGEIRALIPVYCDGKLIPYDRRRNHE